MNLSFGCHSFITEDALGELGALNDCHVGMIKLARNKKKTKQPFEIYDQSSSSSDTL